ncbi:MAG: MogA/MoaB family molybdenum cofactor biosynthesis protein [Chloroflexi bacterium]|nr:MogA/MoaB family molybdenum cofactor biosynthesis protein [Chloroflexota bacterium]
MTIRVAILTVSDRTSRGERADASGPLLIERVHAEGWEVTFSAVVPDDPQIIQDILIEWSDVHQVDLILTTGGTGFSPRDTTPEATQGVIQRAAPGLSELMRLESLKITYHAALSRGVSGIRGQTVIVNLPGSPKAAVQNLDAILPILPHAIELLNDNPHSEAGHRSGDAPRP